MMMMKKRHAFVRRKGMETLLMEKGLHVDDKLFAIWN